MSPQALPTRQTPRVAAGILTTISGSRINIYICRNVRNDGGGGHKIYIHPRMWGNNGTLETMGRRAGEASSSPTLGKIGGGGHDVVGEKSRNLTLRHAHRVRSTHCGGVAGRARPAGRAQCDAPRRPLRAARTTAVASCRTAIRQVQRPVVSRPRRPQGRQAARRARAVNTHRKGVERAQGRTGERTEKTP